MTDVASEMTVRGSGPPETPCRMPLTAMSRDQSHPPNNYAPQPFPSNGESGTPKTAINSRAFSGACNLSVLSK